MNGLVGGPLLVGGLGPGPPAPPLNPDLTGPEHSVCCYNPSIVKHDRRLAVITYQDTFDPLEKLPTGVGQLDAAAFTGLGRATPHALPC